MEKYTPNLPESYIIAVEVSGKTLFLAYSFEYDPWTISPSHGNPPTFEIEKIDFELVEQPSEYMNFLSISNIKSAIKGESFDQFVLDKKLGLNKS